MVASRIPGQSERFDRRNPNHPFLINGGKDLRGGNVPPHELIQHINFPALAAANDATIIPSDTEQAPVTSGRISVRQRIEMTMREVTYLPQLARIVGRQAADQILTWLEREYKTSAEIRSIFEGQTDKDQSDRLEFSPNPGWWSFLGHMEALLENAPLPVNRDAEFRLSRPDRDVIHVAIEQAQRFIERGRPQVIPGHSQGGLVGVLTMLELQRKQRDDLPAALIGIAPVINGVPPHIEALIDYIGRHIWPALLDMKYDSRATAQIGELSDEMRSRIVVVQHKLGDGLTDMPGSYVKGATIIAPNEPFGHATADMNSGNSAARSAIAVMHTLAAAHEISRQPAYY